MTVDFEATLVSRSRTPVDALHARLLVEEQAGLGPQMRRHHHLDQSLRLEGIVLAHEQKVIPFTWVLPPEAPPSWKSKLSRIQYTLELRVDIPWWPDRTVLYELPVFAAPRPLPPRPGAFSNATGGPRGTELIVELALQSLAVEQGGVLRGAVAVLNAEHHAIERLEVVLDALDTLKPGTASDESWRSAPQKVTTGAPENGRAYPFELRVPDTLPPSFEGALVTLEWRLEARAAVSPGKDVTVAALLDVSAASGVQSNAEAVGAVRVAPLGSERRVLIWREVAARTGLVSAVPETMSGRFGPVSLEIGVELRAEQLFAVATLEWRPLGLELSFTERRWVHALDPGVALDDAAFAGRFVVRGRRPAQVRALLGASVRRALLKFERVALEDDGALLASRGNGSLGDELERFTREAIATAEALGQAFGAVPPPEGLAPFADAWAAEATKQGGIFCPGDFSIRGAAWRGARVELVTRFDEVGVPTKAVARVLLDKPAVIGAEAQRIRDSLATECEGLLIAEDAVEATFPGPWSEPVRAEALWRALVRLAQSL